MKTVTRYKCDICNEEYSDEAMAAECEQKHIMDLKLISAKYEAIPLRGLRFPVRVVLQSPNGERMAYRAEI